MNENETTYTQGTGKRISELAKQYGIQTPKNSDMLVIAQQNQESETGAVSRATRFDTLAETVRAPHE